MELSTLNSYAEEFEKRLRISSSPLAIKLLQREEELLHPDNSPAKFSNEYVIYSPLVYHFACQLCCP